MTTVPVQHVPSDYRSEVVPDRRVRVGWGSIMMGAVTAIGLQFIFTALGVALGATIDTASARTDAGDLGIMAFVWWLVTGTISLFVGGLVLGRAIGATRTENVCIGAATMWAVVALFGFLVVWSGVGAGVAAATPLSMMSARDNGYAARARDSVAAMGGSPDTIAAPDSAARGDGAPTSTEARRAARTASWWSVIGLIAGVLATWAGAAAGSRTGPVRTPVAAV